MDLLLIFGFAVSHSITFWSGVIVGVYVYRKNKEQLEKIKKSD